MKSELRREYAAARANFTGCGRETADEKIKQNFLKAFGDIKSCFIYNAYNSEAATSDIIKELLSRGCAVYLPKVEGSDMLCVPYGKLYKGAYGIMEPRGEPFFGDVQITVLPLLAVDGRGYRLGYGGGYYDRYLKNHKTLRVGLGYSFQITEKTFFDEWDEPLNAFICERGIIYYDKQ